MKKRDLFNLNQSISLFNYTDADVSLVVKMMKNKTKLNDIIENIKKQLQEIRETLKPKELDEVNEQLKLALLKDDKELIKFLHLKSGLLTSQWNDKYKEAEDSILNEVIDLKLDVITYSELNILRKPKSELVALKESERQVIVTNHFTTDNLAALSFLITE